MKYFLDTEFLEDGKTIQLISIGLVCDDGREYYAVNYLAPFYEIIQHHPWLVENVLPHVGFKKPADVEWVDYYLSSQLNDEMLANKTLFKTPEQIKADLIEFVQGEYPDIEFWAYYGDYDWVATCRLFGRMLDLPKTWPRFCYDLRQWLNHKGLPFIRQPDDAKHNALQDARWGAGTHIGYSDLAAVVHEKDAEIVRLGNRIQALEALNEAEDARPDS